MKKIVALLLVSLLAVAMIVPVSAATPQQDIITAFKNEVPEKYQAEYLPLVENVLQQLDIDADQAAIVVDCIEACGDKIKADKGGSLSEYTSEEQAFILGKFDEACDALNLTYELVPSENPTHKNDVTCIVYTAEGKKMADVDSDAVKKTDVADSVNYSYALAAIVLALGAAAAFLYGKKVVADR